MRNILRQIHSISVVTFHEILREKILWSAFIFAIFCVLLAYAVSNLSFIDNAGIAFSFGVTAISLIGGLIAIILGATLIAKEVQNRTLYLVLTKAIWRWQFVVGKFTGLLYVLGLNLVLMMGAVIGILYLLGWSWQDSVLQVMFLQAMEFGVLAATACVFSAFSTSTFAAIFATGIWVIGHALPDLVLLSDRLQSSSLAGFVRFTSRVLPDLTRFDIKSQATHQIAVGWGSVLFNGAYGLAYILFALTVSCVIFSRRNL